MSPVRILIVLWLVAATACGRGPQEPHGAFADADPERGQLLIRTYGCGSCHTVPGVPGARGMVGPPLWAMGERAYIAGVLPNTRPDMIRWIRDPRQVNPLTLMPNTGVTEDEARDIAAYLSTLHAEPQLVRLVRGFMERGAGRQVSDPPPAGVR